ncbi:MAG TPA: hypothetical protein GX525_06580 [Bacilli bacterium]|nr:hypothetical protein [Bacilli bacterium]
METASSADDPDIEFLLAQFNIWTQIRQDKFAKKMLKNCRRVSLYAGIGAFGIE